MNALGIWMNGEHVGRWDFHRGAHTLSYAPGWRDSPRGRPLSLSLPFTADLKLAGPAVQHYFDNLLPDNAAIRERLRRRHRTASTEAFSLLSAIGRDCVGAVQLLPPDEAPQGVEGIDAWPLSDDEVARHLDDMLSGSGLGAGGVEGDSFRISIAGAQEKTALLRLGSRWMRPQGATPTSHILKLPLGVIGGLQLDMRESVENEWLCLQLLQALGLPVAHSEMARFGRHRVLVVERFDRAWVDGARWLARLPQEDFCQATGTAPAHKYEEHGGPGMAACLRLLMGSSQPRQDRGVFLLSQLAFWMLAAIDGHAKNFSLFLMPGGRYHATPLYDVLSAWPIQGRGAHQLHLRKMKLAMAVRTRKARYLLHEIQPRHWRELADREADGLWPTMVEMAGRVPGAIEAVQGRLPADFPPRVWDSITAGLAAQAERFLAQP